MKRKNTEELKSYVDPFNGYGMKRGDKIVIEAKYENEIVFEKGLACVLRRDDLHYGFIDEQGNTVIPFIYDYAEPFFEDDEYTTVNINGFSGVIDRQGRHIAECRYDEVSFTGPDEPIITVLDSKYGLTGNDGREILPCRYKSISCFREGFAQVNDNSKYGCIDTDGKFIVECIYTYIDSFSEGRAVVRNGDKYGYINTHGDVIVSIKYDEAFDFKNKLAVVRLGNKYGFIDYNGNEITPIKYDKVTDFVNDAATVMIKDKVGQISGSGEILIPCIYYSSDIENAFDFSSGLSAVRTDSNGKYGFIDKNGNVVMPFVFDYAEHFVNDRALIRSGNETFYINAKGRPTWSLSRLVKSVKKQNK